MRNPIYALIGIGILVHASTASAQEIVATYEPDPNDPALDLGSYQHPAGGNVLTLFGGAGSGSYRGPIRRTFSGRSGTGGRTSPAPMPRRCWGYLGPRPVQPTAVSRPGWGGSIPDLTTPPASTSCG